MTAACSDAARRRQAGRRHAIAAAAWSAPPKLPAYLVAPRSLRNRPPLRVLPGALGILAAGVCACCSAAGLELCHVFTLFFQPRLSPDSTAFARRHAPRMHAAPNKLVAGGPQATNDPRGADTRASARHGGCKGNVDAQHRRPPTCRASAEARGHQRGWPPRLHRRRTRESALDSRRNPGIGRAPAPAAPPTAPLASAPPAPIPDVCWQLAQGPVQGVGNGVEEGKGRRVRGQEGGGAGGQQTAWAAAATALKPSLPSPLPAAWSVSPASC
jgi:hypothetical protein